MATTPPPVRGVSLGVDESYRSPLAISHGRRYLQLLSSCSSLPLELLLHVVSTHQVAADEKCVIKRREARFVLMRNGERYTEATQVLSGEKTTRGTLIDIRD